MVFVFVAGGLLGLGVVRYLSSRATDGDSSQPHASVTRSSASDQYGSPNSAPPSTQPGNQREKATLPAGQAKPSANPPEPSSRQRQEESPLEEDTGTSDRKEPPPTKRNSPQETPDTTTPSRRDEPSASKEANPPRRREEPSASKEANPPRRREEPSASKEANPPPRRDETSALPRREKPPLSDHLKSLVAAMKSRKLQEQVHAVEELGKLGEAARPALRDLCEILAANNSPSLRQAGLTALEKIHAELHRAVIVLMLEEDAQKHPGATRELARLGEEARGSLPILLAHIKTAAVRFPNDAPILVGEDAAALVQIAPDDAAVHKMLLDLTQYTAVGRYQSDHGQVARASAVQNIGELVQKRPEQAKHIVPGFIASIRTMTDDQVRSQAVGVLGTVAENQPDLRPQIAAAFLALLRKGEAAAITQIAKCGRDAKDAIPFLKQLKLHQNESIRTAATEALAQIEDAIASGTVPPRRDDSSTRGSDQPARSRPSASRIDDEQLPAELRASVARLRTGASEDKIKAADELAGMGEKAIRASRALCETALSASEKVRRAALNALEKIHPDLHATVFVLIVDEKADNHIAALTKLGLLGDQGKPAVPVVLHQIKTRQEQLTSDAARRNQHALVQVIIKNMETLPKIAPEDPQVVKTLIELTKFTTQRAFEVQRKRHWVTTPTPFRGDAVRLLGDVAEKQLDHRKQIAPVLVTVLKEETQQTKSANENQVLVAIEEVAHTGEALLKCGPDAKQSLTKEVLPRLKDLQFHKSEKVRTVAEQLRKKIEEAE
jgi:HEAT repeat protein